MKHTNPNECSNSKNKKSLQDKWNPQRLDVTMKNIWNKNLQSHTLKLLDLEWTLDARATKTCIKKLNR
jgi:hypothetical protein